MLASHHSSRSAKKNTSARVISRTIRITENPCFLGVEP